ncbi:hypothetical protein BD779DRAFT_1051741 [Infundibulicybe gibba]|nr:hypothetical protein BD779DRAFT_1051741 [Infundibulicybe gibba]
MDGNAAKGTATPCETSLTRPNNQGFWASSATIQTSDAKNRKEEGKPRFCLVSKLSPRTKRSESQDAVPAPSPIMVLFEYKHTFQKLMRGLQRQ